MLRKYLSYQRPIFNILTRTCVHKINSNNLTDTNKILDEKFETVFNFPLVKSFALFNRLKVYQTVGTAIAIPTCAALEMSNIVSGYYTLALMYIGKLTTQIFINLRLYFFVT